MSDRWIQPTPTHIEVRTHIGITRYIFGMPFLLFGLYFFVRYVVGSIVAYAAAGDWWGLLASIPGFFLALVFAAVFAVPGALIAFSSRHLVLDIVRNEMIETRSILFRDFVIHRSLASYTRLMITSKGVEGTWLYKIWLITADDQRTLVGSMTDQDEARALADVIGTLVCLPVSTMSEAQWLEG